MTQPGQQVSAKAQGLGRAPAGQSFAPLPTSSCLWLLRATHRPNFFIDNVPPSRLEEAQAALLLGPQSCPRLLIASPLAGPPPPHSLFRRLRSGPSLILISIGLSLLLLVVVCVIGSQSGFPGGGLGREQC